MISTTYETINMCSIITSYRMIFASTMLYTTVENCTARMYSNSLFHEPFRKEGREKGLVKLCVQASTLHYVVMSVSNTCYIDTSRKTWSRSVSISYSNLLEYQNSCPHCVYETFSLHDMSDNYNTL